MANSNDKYTLSSAGTSAFNGEYSYDSEYADRHCYKNTNNKYLLYSPMSFRWEVHDDKDYSSTCYYYSAGHALCGNDWFYDSGASPAPTATYTGDRKWTASGAGIEGVNGEYEYYGETSSASIWRCGSFDVTVNWMDGTWAVWDAGYYSMPYYSGPTSGVDFPGGSPWTMTFFQFSISPAGTVAIDGAGYTASGFGDSSANGFYEDVGGGALMNMNGYNLALNNGRWEIAGWMGAQYCNNDADGPEQGTWSVMFEPAPTWTDSSTAAEGSESASPSMSPSISPSASPSDSPSASPSDSPSASPSTSPSESPSASPSPGYSNYSRGDYGVLPLTDAGLDNNYTAQDLLDIAANDAAWVSQSAQGEYAIHMYKDYLDLSSASIIWVGKSSTAPASSPVYLQIYNYDSEEWETLDSDNSTASDTDFALTAEVADLTNYKSSGMTCCRVCQADT